MARAIMMTKEYRDLLADEESIEIGFNISRIFREKFIFTKSNPY
jgi:hypothetical protein